MDLETTATLVAEARALRDGGDPEAAIAMLREALAEVEADGDHFLASFLTHDLGHAEREPEAQLQWHLACLDHIDAVGDERVKGFYGSAHVNLGLTYLQLGAVDDARRHCSLAEAAAPDLADNDYGRFVAAGIERLRREVEATPAGNRRPDLNPWNLGKDADRPAGDR